MRRALMAACALLVCAAMGAGQPGRGERAGEAGGAAVRFAWVDVYVDSGERALAAYQIDLRAAGAPVAIVGIEGGEHAAFASAPYYDPRAMREDRVIIAALSTGENLPAGRTRVARVHVQISGEGEPEYTATLAAAATGEGERFEAKIAVEQGEAR